MVEEEKKKRANAEGVFNINRGGGEQSPEPRSITIARAAYVARSIRDKCNNVHQQTLGEVMELDSGLVVVISKAICDEDDTVNDNVW